MDLPKMETILEGFEDSSSPLMFEGSSQPDDLSNVSFGSHLEYPDGSIPTVTKAHSGRMSPVRARTMKEYDQQIADLKKENFSLKLRIYFLEERVQQQFDGDSEGLFKTNINLKVEVESMKKELGDKQELLKKASHAMESLATQHQVEAQQIREQIEGDMRQAVEELEGKLHSTEKECYDSKKSLDEANQRLQELEKANKDLLDTIESQVAQDKQDAVEEKYKELIGDKDNQVEEMRLQLVDMEAKVNQLEAEKVDTLKELHSRVNALQNDMPPSGDKIETGCQTSHGVGDYSRMDSKDDPDGLADTSQRDGVEEYRRRVEELEVVLDHLTAELAEKDGIVATFQDTLREKDKSIKDFENKLTKAQEEVQRLNDNATKRDKAIQGLTLALHEKGNEVKKLCEKIEELEGNLTQAKADLHRHHMSKYQDEEQIHQKLNDREGQLAELEAQLRKKQLELERLEKNNGRKEAENRQLKDNVGRLEETLQHSEDTLHELSDKLHEEKEKAKKHAEGMESQYQGLVEDSQRQLQSKDKLVQQLTKSLREKDQQLQQYMDMVQEASNKPYTENKDLIISNLRDRLKEREKALENAMEEKFKLAEEKDGEMRQNKMAVREKDRDLERANQALLTAEETIDTLEREMKEKDQTLRQLTNALRARQKALEEAQDNHTRGIEEKEGIIGKLQKSLANKDKYVEDLINQQSPGGSDVVIVQLRQQIAEKDRLLEEMMTERSKAAVANEKAANDLLGKLRDKDDEIKELNEDNNRQLANLNKELQKSQTDMNKKDYEVQLLTNRATWAEEQQQAMMDKMRAALGEKDKTIEALVESGREKDKMFRQMQESFAAQQPISASRTAELQNLRDEVDRLQNELLSKEGLISRLRANMDRNPQHQVSKAAYDELLSELERKEKDRRDAVKEVAETKDQMSKLMKQLSSLKEKEAENDRLKIEVKTLHECPDYTSTPQRSQATGGSETHVHIHQMLQDQLKEAQNLSDVLKAEKDVYVNLSQAEEKPKSSSHHEIHVQLNQIEALRQQLQESIESNQNIRDQLLLQIRKSLSHQRQSSPDSDNDLQKKIEALQNQLEEAKRWNLSLQSRLNQQQTRGGGVGADLSVMSPGQDATAYASLLQDPEKPSDVSFDSDQALLKMAPAELRQEITRLRGQLRNAQDLGVELQHRLNIAEEMRDIPGESELDQVQRSEVADAKQDDIIAKLRQELSALQNELREKSVRNDALVQQRDSLENDLMVAHSMSQKNLLPGDLDDKLLQMKHQLQLVQIQLQEKCAECETLRQQLMDLEHSQGDVRSIQSLQSENIVLREKLGLTPGPLNVHDILSVNDLQNKIVKLETKLKEANDKIGLFKRQIEMNSSSEAAPGFNPQLLVDMSKEVERLKKELAKARQEAKAGGKPPGSERKSLIPILRRKSSNDSMDRESDAEQADSLRDELKEIFAQKQALETQLVLAESSLQAQTAKIRSYKGMLEDAGLLSRGPSRSQSLTDLTDNERPSKSRSSSVDNTANSQEHLNHPSGIAGLSPDAFEHFGTTNDTSTLQDQIQVLKSQIERYLKIIKSLRERLKESKSSFRPVTPPSDSSCYTAMGYPQTPGIDHFLAMNQDAFVQLHNEVDLLKDQLREKEEHNASLMDLLSMVSPNVSSQSAVSVGPSQPVRAVSIESELRKLAMQQNRDAVVQRENETMKSKLKEGRQHCEDLATLLIEVHHLVGSVRQDDNGAVEASVSVPSSVTELKQGLDDASRLVGQLVVVLDASVPVDSSEDELPLRKRRSALPLSASKLDKALKKCAELELQNRKLNEERDILKKKLAVTSNELMQQCKKLVSENEEVKHKLLQHDGDLAKQCKKLLDENEEAKQRLIKTDTDLSRKCHSLETKNHILEQEKESLERKVVDCTEAVAKSTDRCQTLAKENNDLQRKSSEQALELARMAAQAKKVMAELDEARRTLVESEVMRKTLAEEKAEVEDRECELKQKLADIESQLKSVQTEAEDLKKQLAASKTSHDQVKRDLQKRLDLYNKLKEHLKKNKDAADENRKELHKCSKKIQEKDDLINRLKQKLRQMKQKVGRQSSRRNGEQPVDSSDEEDVKSNRQRLKVKQKQPDVTETEPSLPGESDSDHTLQRSQNFDSESFLSSSQTSITDRLSVDRSSAMNDKGPALRSDDSFSTERLRHRVASGPNHGIHAPMDMCSDFMSEGSTTSSRHQRTSPTHKPYSDLDMGSNGNGTVQEPEPDLHMSLKELSSFDRNFEMGASAKFEKDELRMKTGTIAGNHSYSERTERNYSPGKPVRLEDLSPRSQTLLRSQSTESDSLLHEIEVLKSKLKVSEDLNQKLHDELSLYDILSIRTATALNGSKYTSTHNPAGRENGQILADHLEEIRLLRERLEESIKTYDQLRQQMEEKLSQLDREDAVTFDTLQKDYLNARQQYESLCREVQEKDNLLHESKEILVNQDAAIREKQTTNDALEKKVKELEESLREAKLAETTHSADLKNKTEENKRLKDGINMLQEQVKQNEELIKTLQSELKDLEKITSNKKASDHLATFGFEIGDLLEEIGRLRVQLERSISTNNALRKRLEQLAKGQGQNLSASLRSLLQPMASEIQKPVKDQLDRVHLQESPQATKSLSTPDSSSHALLGEKEFHHRHSGSQGSNEKTLDIFPENERSVSRKLNFNRSVPTISKSAPTENDHCAANLSNPAPTPRRPVIGQEKGSDRKVALQNGFQNIPSPDRSLPAQLPNQISNFMSSAKSTISEGSGNYSVERLDKFLDNCGPSSLPVNGNVYEGQVHSGTPSRSAYYSRLTHSGYRDFSDLPLTAADLEKENFFPSMNFGRSAHLDTFRDEKGSSLTTVSSLPGYGASHTINIPLTDVSKLKICSDLRYLFAIGKLDDYELLKKEIGESAIIIRGMEARIAERIKTFKGASPLQNLEYLTLKELSSAVENLGICLKEENRIVRQFWTSQLPPKNTSGEYVDVKAWEENQDLREKLAHLEGQYAAAMKMMKNAQKRLQATNRKKENMEEAIYRSLAQTEKMMRQARSNLQNRNRDDDSDEY